MAKRILCLFFALMMIASGAMAMNKDRFLNESDVSIDENEVLTYGIISYARHKDDPDFSPIFMTYVEGYIHLYMGKTQIALGIHDSILVTTDERVYYVSPGTNADEDMQPSIGGLGLPMLVNKDIAGMLQDISTSDTCIVTSYVFGNSYDATVSDEQKHMLGLIADEYNEVIAPILASMPERSAMTQEYAQNEPIFYSTKK